MVVCNLNSFSLSTFSYGYSKGVNIMLAGVNMLAFSEGYVGENKVGDLVGDFNAGDSKVVA